MTFIAAAKVICPVCTKTVYANDEVRISEHLVLHKTCFRCSQCNKVLQNTNFSQYEGVYFCKPHFMALFKARGKYDDLAPNSSFSSSMRMSLSAYETKPASAESPAAGRAKTGDISSALRLRNPQMVQGLINRKGHHVIFSSAGADGITAIETAFTTGNLECGRVMLKAISDALQGSAFVWEKPDDESKDDDQDAGGVTRDQEQDFPASAMVDQESESFMNTQDLLSNPPENAKPKPEPEPVPENDPEPSYHHSHHHEPEPVHHHHHDPEPEPVHHHHHEPEPEPVHQAWEPVHHAPEPEPEPVHQAWEPVHHEPVHAPEPEPVHHHPEPEPEPVHQAWEPVHEPVHVPEPEPVHQAWEPAHVPEPEPAHHAWEPVHEPVHAPEPVHHAWDEPQAEPEPEPLPAHHQPLEEPEPLPVADYEHQPVHHQPWDEAEPQPVHEQHLYNDEPAPAHEYEPQPVHHQWDEPEPQPVE